MNRFFQYAQKKPSLRRGLCLALALILFLLPGASLADSLPRARELTKKCTIEATGYAGANLNRLLSHDVMMHQDFSPEGTITVSWKEDVHPCWLCLEWFEMPEGVTIRLFDQAGELSREERPAPVADTILPIGDEIGSVVIQAGEQGMKISCLCVFGPGELPDPFHLWQETPDHLDYLLIATHPDDDVLYMGSVVPVYGAEQGYVGSIAYVTCMARYRMRVPSTRIGSWGSGIGPSSWGSRTSPGTPPRSARASSAMRRCSWPWCGCIGSTTRWWSSPRM